MQLFVVDQFASEPGIRQRALNILMILAANFAAYQSCSSPDSIEPRFEARITSGIVYGTGNVTTTSGQDGTKALELDVYEPRSYERTDKAAVILIHGGGFTGGHRDGMSHMGRFLAQRGFVCFAISYRLSVDNPPAVPDAAFADAFTAVRWIRANAEYYGIAKHRIGVMGHSAGAFSAAVVATCYAVDFLCDGPTISPFNSPSESSRVQAAVICSGGTTYPEALDPSDPPLMLVHGTADFIVPIAHAEQIRDAYIRDEIPYLFCPLEGVGHEPLNEVYEGMDVRELIASFLWEKLENASPFPPDESSKNDKRLKASSSGLDWVSELVEAVRGDSNAKHERVDPPVHRLDVSETKNGEVIIDPPGGIYAEGTLVTLTAAPQENHVFGFWAGDVRAIQETIHVRMDMAKRIQAGFVERRDVRRHTLTIASNALGAIHAVPDKRDYLDGERVSLQVTPSAGNVFVGWKGDDSGIQNPVSVVMDDSKTMRATIRRILSAAPLSATVSAAGGNTEFLIRTAEGTWRVDPVWERPWLTFSSAKGFGKLGVVTVPNQTPYARTVLLRLRSDMPNVEALDLLVTQEGIDREGHPPASATGSAIYEGLKSELGLLAWWSGSTAPPGHRILEANPERGYVVGSFSSAAIGYLTIDGTAPLLIPDGTADYHIYASWDLPNTPDAWPGQHDKSIDRSSYCYVGIDSGSIDHSKLRFGVEWKDIGSGPEWVVRSQRESREIAIGKIENKEEPILFQLHIWKDQDGDSSVHPGSATVQAEFRIDEGAWNHFTFVTPGPSDVYPIGGLGFDRGDDFVTFKVRGFGTPNMKEIRVEGESIPSVN